MRVQWVRWQWCAAQAAIASTRNRDGVDRRSLHVARTALKGERGML